MKRFRELLITGVLVGGLGVLLYIGALAAQTSLFEIRGALNFVSFDPKAQFLGNLTFEKPDGTDVAELTDTSMFHLVETTNLPPTGDLSSDGEFAMFTCEDTLVFAYNNGGTLTYISLDLDGSDTSFTHGTSTLNFNTCTQ